MISEIAEGGTGSASFANLNGRCAVRDLAMHSHAALRDGALASTLYFAAVSSCRRTPAFLFSYAILLQVEGAPLERVARVLQCAGETTGPLNFAYADNILYSRAVFFPGDLHAQLNYAVALFCLLCAHTATEINGNRGHSSQRVKFYARRAEIYFRRALGKVHGADCARRSHKLFRRCGLYLSGGTVPTARLRRSRFMIPWVGGDGFAACEARMICARDVAVATFCVLGSTRPSVVALISISTLCRAIAVVPKYSEWKTTLMVYKNRYNTPRFPTPTTMAAKFLHCRNDCSVLEQALVRALCRWVIATSVVAVDKAGELQCIVPEIDVFRRAALRTQNVGTTALTLQRSFRGFCGRRAFSRRRSQRLAAQRREAKLGARREIRKARHGFVNSAAVCVQARWRGILLRMKLAQMHAAALRIQSLVRGHLGRLRALEHERRLRMGPLVREVYYRGCVVSGKYLLLTVRQSGNNYRLFGFDLAAAEEYRGLVKQGRVMKAIEAHPYGADGAYGRNRRQQIRVWQHPRVLKLLLSKLMLVEPIKGLGEFQKNACKKVLIVFLGSSNGGGRGILSSRSSWPSRMITYA